MKNIFRAFLAAVALFATVACSQDDNVGRTFGDKAITIDSSSVTFTDAPSKNGRFQRLVQKHVQRKRRHR